MPFVPEAIAVNAERRRNGSRYHPVGSDLVERLEQAGDVAIRLFDSPLIPSVAIDFVETVRGRRLDADGGHSSDPVPRDHWARRQRLRGRLGRSKRMRKLGLQPVESLFPHALAVPTDQIADILADILVG